jgi:magnesium chelatase subunit D
MSEMTAAPQAANQAPPDVAPAAEPEAAPGPLLWDRALRAAALFAVDPAGLGGLALRAPAGPARETFLAVLRTLLPAEAPLRRMPFGIADSRLLGGLDLVATLRAGRPVADRGLLAESDGGAVVLAMAERVSPATAAKLAATLDSGEVVLERDGLTLRTPARIGLVALDEGLTDDERAPDALTERLGFLVNLTDVSPRDIAEGAYRPDDVRAARQRIDEVRIADQLVEALCATALALGIGSLRASLNAIRAAKAAAALAGRTEVEVEDAELAGQLVLAPRARHAPAPPPPEEPPEDDQDEDRQDDPPPEAEDDKPEPDRLPEDLVLEATQAAIPPGLLAQFERNAKASKRAGAGKAGAQKKSGVRGRPAGVRQGAPKHGERLNVIETLRAAAPWQRLRRDEAGVGAPDRIRIAAKDFHVTRYKQRTETVTIFAVDASGSSALNRLAEAKGAVEILLAECYVRRDQVAVLAFRGRAAELLLPPTRSLLRAKRSLADLPGGGGTPLAAGIEAAIHLAEEVKRKGQTPFVVFMTDGAANIAAGGKAAGRAKAREDALAAARIARSVRLPALVIDIAPRAQPAAAELAIEMNAPYLPLPYADAAVLARVTRAAEMSQ